MNLKITFLIIFQSAISNVPAQSIRLSGKVTDCDTLMVLLTSDEKNDTLFTNNGTFQFSRISAFPQLFRLRRERHAVP